MSDAADLLEVADGLTDEARAERAAVVRHLIAAGLAEAAVDIGRGVHRGPRRTVRVGDVWQSTSQRLYEVVGFHDVWSGRAVLRGRGGQGEAVAMAAMAARWTLVSRGEGEERDAGPA